jgi:acetaldehyde dehydrogenase/alcohol dehydrogenase
VIRYNATDTPSKQTAFSQYDRPQARHRYGELAQLLGLQGRRTAERIDSLVAWVEELKTTLGIPASIQAAGVEEAAFLAKVDRLAEEAFDDQCTGTNPRFPLLAELRRILVDSYYGRAYQEKHHADQHRDGR